MRRSTLNLTLDALSFVVLAAMIATGFVLRFILPPGSRGGRGLSLWEMTRHDWGDIHFWLAIGVIGLLLVHLILHWSWVYQVSCMLLKRGNTQSSHASNRERGLIGAAVLAAIAVLIAAFLFIASSNVEVSRARDSDGATLVTESSTPGLQETAPDSQTNAHRRRTRGRH